jgi:hypothetical protein
MSEAAPQFAAAAGGGPSGPQRVISGLFVLALAVVGLATLAVLLIAAVPVAIGAIVVLAVTRWVRGLRAPNGPLDGRRNVRVIVRDPGAPGA